MAILLLASAASFGLGFLAGRDAVGQGSDVTISLAPPPAAGESTAVGQVVASKNGTKYYFLSCAGASRISEGNKVYFDSAAAAEAQGYQRASGCNAP